MANYRIPYLVGNKLGRDHQYWPAIDLEFDDADYAFSVNLATLMQMAWRVREWTVSAGTMSYTWLFTPGDPGSELTFVGSWSEFTMEVRRAENPDWPGSGDFYFTAANEGEILGPASSSPILVLNALGHVVDKWHTLRNLGVRGRDEGSWAAEGLPDFVGGVIQAGILGGELTFDPVRKVFASVVSLVGGAAIPGGHPSIQFSAISANDLAANPGWYSGGTLTVIDPAGGADLVAPLAVFGQDVSDLGGSGTVDNITMTPTKWWKYRNSLGQDVYDEFSGVQINDPFA